MANTKNTARQYPLVAVLPYGPNQGAGTVSVVLPPGAIVIGGVARVSAAGAASLKVAVTDAASSPVSLFGAVDAVTLAGTAMPVAGLGLSYPAGTTLTLALSASDNTAAGVVAVSYVIAGRQNEAYTA